MTLPAGSAAGRNDRSGRTDRPRALLDAAMPLCRGLGCREALLIVPRPSVAGKRLALRRGAD